MFRFILRDDDLETSFLSLSKQFPAPIEEDTLHLPPHRGSGTIRSVFLEEGLYLRYSRLHYHEDIEFFRLPKQPESETIFVISFFLDPSPLKLGKPFSGDYLSAGDPYNLFLTSNNTRLLAHIPSGALSHTVEFLFSQDWLMTHIPGIAEKIRQFHGILREDAPMPVMADTVTPEDDHLLIEIAGEMEQPLFNPLKVRSRALVLLSNIINRLSAPRLPKQEPDESHYQSHYLRVMKQVKQKLLENLENMPPPQKELAREFALSESTLKRHFKNIYGLTMYEFYLERKMELARHLLREKKLGVSETAYALGYEKPSSFISIFKKYYGSSPGSLK